MCAACQVTLGIIHCSDCFGTPVWCCGCALEVHSALPFHRIQLWNGKCFLKTSLFEQGFMIHLGHDGHPCSAHPTASSPWVDVHMHKPNLTREDEDIGKVVDEILEDPFFTFVPPPSKMILLLFMVEECAISMCSGVFVQIALPITFNSFRLIFLLPASLGPRQPSPLICWTIFTWMQWSVGWQQ